MNLEEAIMNRDGVTREEAQQMIVEMRRMVWDGGYDPIQVLESEGFEPDYVFDLID